MSLLPIINNSMNQNSMNQDQDQIKEERYNLLKKNRNLDYNLIIEDPEILVWSNDKTAKINHMLGTDDNFILTNYNKEERLNEKKS